MMKGLAISRNLSLEGKEISGEVLRHAVKKYNSTGNKSIWRRINDKLKKSFKLFLINKELLPIIDGDYEVIG